MSIQAVEAQSEERNDGATLQLSFCAVRIQNKQSRLFLQSGAQKEGDQVTWQEARLNVHTISESIKYKGGRVLSFYEKAELGAARVAEVKLPASGRSFVLVFVPSVKSRRNYRVLAIPEKGFQFGNYHFKNLSKIAVAIELGNRKELIKGGASLSIAAARNGKPERVVMKIKPDDRIRVIKQTQWRLQPRQRELVILYAHSEGKRVLLKHFVSIKPEE